MPVVASNNTISVIDKVLIVHRAKMLIGENQPIIQVMCVPLTTKANSPPLIFTHADLSNRQKTAYYPSFRLNA